MIFALYYPERKKERKRKERKERKRENDYAY